MESLNSSHELSLDFKPAFIPKTITRFLKEVSKMGGVNEKVLQVDDFVDRLEMEMNKIEAFNQEVPLCMFLINDAILALKEESVVLKRRVNVEPVFEEFIPLKNSYDEDGNDVKVEIIANQKDNSDKKNWLSSTHLWNTNENIYEKPNSIAKTFKKRDEEDVARRSIFSPEIRRSMRGNGFLSEIDCKSRLIPSATPNVESNIRIGVTMPVPPQQHTSRKLRRCWSTELHRRFINALQQLGGSQVATPKQIRELMQVDGLTNDEVKSHLQKYKLHTRRLPSLNKNQSVRSSKCSNSQSGSPDGPLTNGGNNMDDHEDEKSENYY